MSRIVRFTDRTRAETVRCDVCIVGSGAGGAVLAAKLAEAGHKVVIIEEGSPWPRQQLTLQERDAYPGMYQERATRATADQAITILQGRTVGGSTTINWTTCFRTPAHILAHWESHFGWQNASPADMDPHFASVEERLNIHRWEAFTPNANNHVIERGAEALGWEWGRLRRNVRGCANSGYCGMGCPVDGKQAMGITYLVDAMTAGATIYAETRALRFERQGDRVVALEAVGISPGAGSPDGFALRVEADRFVSSGGAINTPALLLRSGLDGGGRVGKRTFIHPVVALLGIHKEPVEPYYGAPQSVGSHQFIHRGAGKMGFFLEAAPLHPVLGAVAFHGFGEQMAEKLGHLPYISATLALCVDGVLEGDVGGEVTLTSTGQPKLHYPIREPLKEAFQAAHRRLFEVVLASGAEEAMALHHDTLRMHHLDALDAVDHRTYGAHQHAIFTAHQMGGCTMGADPNRSVVDLQHRVRGISNLYVVDGSILPTALGVNPSQTIYGIAHRAAGLLT